MTNTTAPAARFSVALSAVKGETRNLLPSRPGLPGQPVASYATVSAWMADTKAVAAVVAEGRLDIAVAALEEGNLARYEALMGEARALLALATSR